MNLNDMVNSRFTNRLVALTIYEELGEHMLEKHDFPPCIPDFRVQRLPKLSQRVLIPCMQKYSANTKKGIRTTINTFENQKPEARNVRTAACE